MSTPGMQDQDEYTPAPTTGTVANIFATPKNAREATNALAQAESDRAVAETQAAVAMAKRFPRDQVVALDRILQAFTRPSLAEVAMYSYARGGTDITGPSIRAAETIAQQWGNIQFGVRELEQRNGESTVEAFAWDVETNTRSVKTFQVSHIRQTKRGSYRLTDPRDIYEMVANQGARRLRAAILSIIPGDVVETAIRQAEVTLTTKAEVTPERLASLVEKFAEYGVTKAAIEQRIQRRLDAMTPALLVQIGKIYNSIKDGMSTAADWFDLQAGKEEAEQTPPVTRTDSVASKLAQRAAASQTPEAPQELVPGSEATVEVDNDGDVVGDPPQATEAQPQAEQPPAPAPQEPVDEKKLSRDLRVQIVNAWKAIPDAKRAEIFKREYAKSALTDLTISQMQDFLARTDALQEGLK